METSLLPSESYCLLEVLLMSAILASFFNYDPQKTIGIVSTSGSYTWFAYLFVNRRLSTTLSQSPAFYSTLLSVLLQTMVLCLISHSLVIHVVSIHYL